MRLNERIKGWLRRWPRVETTPVSRVRGPVDHVVIIDGSMSKLARGRETNAGKLYKLLCQTSPSPNLSLRYEAGIQWQHWRNVRDIIEGRGINRQIRRVYGAIASRYRPGDRIFLFGYSRGAYAVRSLAGVIDSVGLLRPENATVRNIRQAYRHYQCPGSPAIKEAFTDALCHDKVEIEMIGVWDTVKALGLRLPIVWRWTQTRHRFHNHTLGNNIRHGYHALALDETRAAFSPVLWDITPDCIGTVEQVWFRGSHGDVGGHLGGKSAARPLANIPLVWMLNKAAALGLPLASDWQNGIECDPNAPSVGTWHGYGWLFLTRRKRCVGTSVSESLHSSVPPEQSRRSGFTPGQPTSI